MNDLIEDMVEFSILIVSHNRKEELIKTLSILKRKMEGSKCEVLVFLDACTDGSHTLIDEFSWVKWSYSNEKKGASPARKLLYSKGRGKIFIGLDDDAHPLHQDFLTRISSFFDQNSQLGILAFKEVKGLYETDEEALKLVSSNKGTVLCSEFVGCGFAIKADVYFSTQGFPEWMDIYGEEACVSIEVLAQDYDIMYTHKVAVNHRINSEKRFQLGRNYFRFGKQLRNSFFFFVVYYKNPFWSIIKLLKHNFIKYAIRDVKYFKIYFKEVFRCFVELPSIMKYRKPLDKSVIEKRRKLSFRLF